MKLRTTGRKSGDQNFAELQTESDEMKDAVASGDRAAMEKHSLAASTIASDIGIDIESIAESLGLPAYLAAASGAVGPVPFEGMEDTKVAENDNEDK